MADRHLPGRIGGRVEVQWVIEMGRKIIDLVRQKIISMSFSTSDISGADLNKGKKKIFLKRNKQ